MAEILPCGHSVGYMYRIRDMDGKMRKFCFGCMIEKLGMTDYNGFAPVKSARVKPEAAKKKIVEKHVENV